MDRGTCIYGGPSLACRRTAALDLAGEIFTHAHTYVLTNTRAIDRVHRLGQRRDVQVFRFTVKDTVEQQMLVIQAR